MNQKEKEILKIEEDFRDTLENELAKQQTKNKKIIIKDIKLVGEISWKDKVNGTQLSDNVFIVEKEIHEIDKDGKERITGAINYYLGDRCIAGDLGNNQPIYGENFKNSEPDKVNAVNELLANTSKEELEKRSFNYLKEKEQLEEKDNEDIMGKSTEKKDNNVLSKKQTEQITVNGLQEVDLNKKVDGRVSLGNRLDLPGFEKMYVVYSDKVNDIAKNSNKKINDTTYSLIGVRKDGTAKILNDEFEIDSSVGNSGSRQTTKIREDGTATRDNTDNSIYKRKSNGMSIGCRNEQGVVELTLYQKTLEENENMGIPIETSQTRRIPKNVQDIMSGYQGINKIDNVQDEIEEHTQNGCTPNDIKDFDGDKNTSTHEHLTEKFDKYVKEIYNYQDEQGEENIKEVFTQKEVKNKLIKEIKEHGDKLSIKQIVENVKQEMDQDSEMLNREHKMQ